MFEGRRGSRWIPRKMAGSAMRTMDASIVAINMPSVVMKSAIHLCRSLAAACASATWVMPGGPSLVVLVARPRPVIRNRRFRFC